MDFQVSSWLRNCSNRRGPDKIYSIHSQRLSIDVTDWQSLDNATATSLSQAATSNTVHILDTVQPSLSPPELSLPISPPNPLPHPLQRVRFLRQRCNVKSSSASQLRAQLILAKPWRSLSAVAPREQQKHTSPTASRRPCSRPARNKPHTLSLKTRGLAFSLAKARPRRPAVKILVSLTSILQSHQTGGSTISG